MSHRTEDVRVIEYWPNEHQRIIVSLFRDPETDAMTDEQLIARFEKQRQEQEEPRHLRVVDDE